MKIFLSFFQSPFKHPIPAYGFWEYYIKKGIKEAGHTWVECPDVDWALGRVPQTETAHSKWKQDAWEKTVAFLKQSPVDMFLSYLYPEQIDTTAINEIKKIGIPCVNFFCDHIRDFTTLPRKFGAFTLNWVPEYKAIDQYKKAGYAYVNLPMPVWVSPQHRIFQPEINPQFAFIGSKDILRHLLFEEIVNHDPELPLAIYGSGWEQSAAPLHSTKYRLKNKLSFQLALINKYGIKGYAEKLKQRKYKGQISPVLQSKIHGVPPSDQYNELTAGSMITAGVNRYPSYLFPLAEPDTYSRLRDIEAPMLGACYLTEWTKGIENLYDINTEIATYTSADDFVEKAKSLQADPTKRRLLKVNGQKRALNDHSIPVTLEKIFTRLGLS
jgi:hypothetical protein